MSVGTIVLIVIGAIVFLSLLGIGVWIWAARKIFKTQEKVFKGFDKNFKDW